jgi:hypothetical protein
MTSLKFFCCLDVYFKLYLRLKFLGFHNHFCMNSMFCLGLVALFVWILQPIIYSSICMVYFFCLDDLYGAFSGISSSRSKI